MFNIHVERTIHKPIEQVFALLSDHEHYAQFPVCDESSLLLHGHHSKNGDGALRMVRLGRIVFEEQIHDFCEPTGFKYRITKSQPFKVDHRIGELELQSVHGGTHVVWRSQGNVPNLLFGWFIERKIERDGAKGFGAILRYIEQLPEQSDVKASNKREAIA
jgi:uncharacterized protein YndB with AHSA1/START domain